MFLAKRLYEIKEKLTKNFMPLHFVFAVLILKAKFVEDKKTPSFEVLMGVFAFFRI